MAKKETIFERIEKKYILDEAQYRGLTARLPAHMQPDAFGEQTLMSLYYDTPDYDLIRRSLDRPVYKEKLRLRSYGYPVKDVVYLELKKKYKGVVYKRREAFPADRAEAFLNGTYDPPKMSQILKEIRYFTDFYRTVPKMMILYERTAYLSVTNEPVRLTIDRNIRYRETGLDLHSGTEGIPYSETPLYVLELKAEGAMPLWLADALAELKIYPNRFSKYGRCYTKKVMEERNHA